MPHRYVTTGLAGLAMVLGSLVAAQAADGPIGTVQKVTPEAFGTPPGGARAVLGANVEVVANETIETSASGSLHLRFIDDSDLWLDQNSSVVLDELVFDRAANAGEYVVELGTGLFRFVTGLMPHQSYEIRTPTALIGVRGTDFAVAVSASGTTRVTAYDGVLTVRARAGGPSVSVAPPATATISRTTGPVSVSVSAMPVGMPEGSAEDRAVPALDVQGLGSPGGGRNVGGGGGSGSGGGGGGGGGGN